MTWLSKKIIKSCIQLILMGILRCLVFSNAKMLRSITFDALAAVSQGRYFLVSDARKRPIVLNLDDEVISRELFAKGEFDAEKLQMCVELLNTKQCFDRNKDSLIVDVGANIGTVTMDALTSGLFNRAVAIEPHPTNYKLLLANIVLNQLAGQVHCVNAAAASPDSPALRLSLSPTNFGDHKIVDKAQVGNTSVIVPSVTCDSLIEHDDFDAFNILLWIDTQGFEGAVLEGSQKFIANRVPIVLEFWPFGLSGHEGMFEKLVEQLSGYTSFIELDGKNVQRPIDDLRALYDEVGFGEHEFTDILLL